MRLGTVRRNTEHDAGATSGALLIADGQKARLLDFPTADAAIRALVDSDSGISEYAVEDIDLRDVTVLAPIPRPGKILGSGINYRGHMEENPEAVLPTEPGFFSKFPSSVIGPHEAVVLPSADQDVDYEVELAVVIGRPGRAILRDDAWEHVFGYTLINDVSGRAAQFRPNQMDLGKGMDTFCPMGPWILTPDEVGPIDGVQLRSWVNGELRQDATTAEWIFDIPALVAHASRFMTLETGDVITTGTPAGCGTFRHPPLWLREGDEIVVEAVGMLELGNHVVLREKSSV